MPIQFKGGDYEPIAEINLIMKLIFKFKGGDYEPIAEINLILKSIFKLKGVGPLSTNCIIGSGFIIIFIIIIIKSN